MPDCSDDGRFPARVLNLRAALCLLLLCVCALHPFRAALAQDAQQEIVDDIRFFGLKRIRRIAIFPKLETSIGAPFSQDVLDRDIHRLYQWNQFEDIQVIKTVLAPGKVKLEFQFVERPYVSGVIFAGRQKIKQETLQGLISTEVGAPAKEFTLQQDEEALRAKYLEKGYSLVDIQTQKLEDGQGGVQIIFQISEGPKMRITDLDIHGNYALTDRRLQKFMQNKQKMFIFRQGRFNFDLLEEDMDRLTAYYRSQGFLDATVETSDIDLSSDMRDVSIDVQVDEGDRYFVRDIRFDIRGDAPDVISERELRAYMRLFEGGPLLWEDLQADTRKIQIMYGALGRNYTQVNYEPEYLENSNEVSLLFKITVSSEVIINRIVIRGNAVNRDKVIRRELSVYPGERFNQEEFERSLSRLRSLNYFARITYDFYPSDAPGLYDLILEVEEQETGRLHLGGAIDVGGGGGIFGYISYQQPNFDARDWPKKLSDWLPGRKFVGGGQFFELRFQPGTRLTQIQFRFREPYLWDQAIGFNVNATIAQLRFIRSDVLTTGINVGVDRRFWRKLLLGASVGTRRQDVHDVSAFAPDDVFAVKGVNWVNTLSLSATMTDVDDYILPSEGYSISTNYDLAGGPLGGDFDYHKIVVSGSKYYTILVNDEELKHILELRSSLGYIKEYGDTDVVPITERFFSGGLGSVRGFEYWEVGPKQNDDPIGGNVSWTSTAEYSFPIPGMGDVMRGALFVDAGNLAADWSDFEFSETRVSTGFGFRVKVPFLGQNPVQLDFGFPIKKEPGDNSRLINFGLKRSF